MLNEKKIDAVLDDFDQWFQTSIQPQPITPFERSILKTFLWYAQKENKRIEAIGVKLEMTDS